MISLHVMCLCVRLERHVLYKDDDAVAHRIIIISFMQKRAGVIPDKPPNLSDLVVCICFFTKVKRN